MVVLRLRGVNKGKSVISLVLRRRSESGGLCGGRGGVSGLHAVRGEHACNLWFG